jgi:acyl-CoA thioesterase-1
MTSYYTSDMPWFGAPGALLSLVLAAVANAAAESPAEPVIVAFGDSLTAGFGVQAEESYPALLERRLRAGGYTYRVVNAGVSGDTTAGGLRRVEWALRLKPEVVIVALGANDGLRGQPIAGIQANLEQMVRRFQSAGGRVVVAGMRLPPNYGPYADQFHRIYAQVAGNTGAVLVPFFLDGVGGNARLNQLDGIHPTAEGYRVVVERLWPYLIPLLNR